MKLSGFKDNERIVISVGGSILVPNYGINVKFISEFNKFIRYKIAQGQRFFLVTGGGKTCRDYIDGARTVDPHITDEYLDWLGIYTSRLNGHLLRTIFRDIAYPRIIDDYDQPIDNIKEPLIVASGWKPGRSTDYCATVLAVQAKAKIIINMTNIDWVYDKDPSVFADARRIEKIDWESFQKIVGTKWKPGLNVPFDPMATQLAKDHNLTVVIVNGNQIDNLKAVLQGDDFNGTIVG